MTSSGVLAVAVWICFAILVASGWRMSLFPAAVKSTVIVIGLSWLLLRNWTFMLAYGHQINGAWLWWIIMAILLLRKQTLSQLLALCGHTAMVAAIWMWLELLSRFSLQMSESLYHFWLIAGVFSCYMLLFTTEWSMQWMTLTFGLTLGEVLVHLRLHSLISAGEGQVQDVWWLTFLIVRLLSAMLEWIRGKFLRGLIGSE
ncbi:hypothetical protein [Paenibacillus sp. B1-33]|uniref:hypothetical protein n=1 Tax=unclassified Paenibacillus TaxID=185978 RepID=UPI003D2757B2